ncbi:MAG: hypothetical protein A4S09_10740 [Proteobacteria bacterium SG_bin7]|nr:MAG: hypothetical protein A4S09_10740 [Proteobacteria bacterium SG_bin7]
MKNVKINRRKFLATGIGFTLGGCTSNSFKPDSRQPAMSPLEFLRSQKLSNDIGELRDDKRPYEAVVVGSGYGASVIAARLAPHFKDLCVIERGREFLPGDFPTTMMGLMGAVRSMVNPLGLIDISSGTDVDIVCGNGLGGTSLINAAIAIKPEKNVFFADVWPREIQEAAKNGTLDKYYDVAESVLKPKVIIRDGETPKSDNHRMITQQMKRKWGALSLNIRPPNFSPRLNEYGYPQGPCLQCGDCCGGCNFGAKNTLQSNYLAMAKNNGAKIFTTLDVASIRKVKDGYLVHATYLGGSRLSFHTIKARHVFVGAGSKGSTHILFRSQGDSMQFSKTLGSRLSANGDVMGMAYNTRYKNNILGMAWNPERLSNLNRPGPIIASYADYRNPSLEGDVNSQFLLLDGVIPSALRSITAKGIAKYILNKEKYDFSDDQKKRIELDLNSNDTADMNSGAMNHSMLYFACGHDSSGGKYVYNKYLKTMNYKWPQVVHEPTFLRINSVMHGFAETMGGVFIPNPRTHVFGHNIQATHPLGGCPMGNNVDEGVVDHLGRVFNAKGGLHENLYVVDAATIPHSLAATPLLTITALAERIADKVRGS